ncbi:prolyl oligopeptidase family protein [Pelomonas sp. KK5]|uniref:prolyl oligopeptidase family serine peptidase n=1 Tax=Pelomonas sp. KK5 TaxID=1855730 RepID=UPI00097CA68A|nr:prolyl oligopeptidase family serine peptidase [Pelomonas sp. KK5]
MQRPFHRGLAASLALLFAAASAAAADADDPNLWLEQLDSPDALRWVQAENEKTRSVLESDPRFAGFKAQALAIEQAGDRIASPQRLGGGLWNFWQDAAHARGVWRVTTPASYEAAGGSPAWTTVLDLDRLAADEKTGWVWKGAQCEPLRERRCLVALSDGGEDALTLREFDLRERRFVPGGFELPRSKQSVAWEDADSLVAARAWAPGEMTKSGYPFVVKRLRRGQPLSAATEIFRGGPDDVRMKLRSLSDAQGRRAVIIQRGLSFFDWDNLLVMPGGVRRLALPAKALVVALYDGQLIVKLDEAWPAAGPQFVAGALAAVDLAQARRAPDALRARLIVAPTARQTLDDVAGTADGLLVTQLDHVRGRASLFRRSPAGAWSATPVALPDDTAVQIKDASPHAAGAYLSVAGYLQPPGLWRVDGRGARLLRALPARFDASGLAVEQFEARSSDGVAIPYSVVHPKSLPLDGSHPTILHAYGGFAVSLAPKYDGAMGKLWAERGGVYVEANIRGGGEFGPAWHEAGLKTRRQIVYDDFAAVARDLIARGFTTPRRLGIMGGSNGGLLVGVEMTQHPELFNAVDIAVPLLDMLRFEQIAAGALWAGEYGSAANADERAFLAGISPYHQLRRDQAYPRPFVWTTSKDDRVGPQHARKFAARLSDYGIPYYFYEFTEGGHSADANLDELARTLALEYVYFSRQLMDR